MMSMAYTVLESFGLSAEEAGLYTELLPLGDVPVIDLIKLTQKHPQIIYRLLDSLSAKGLVLTEIRKHRKYVRAEDPEVFKKSQEQKLEALKALLPELKALQNKPREATVRVARGEEAVRNLRRRAFDELPEGGMFYILSASGTRFYEIMGGTLDGIEKHRVKRKIRKRLLAFESQRKMLEKNEKWDLIEIRYLPESNSVPSSTNIFGNTVAIQIWLSDPIVIMIESPEVAQSYKDYFGSLWKTAKQ